MADRVMHFELPADNVERAQSFYHEAFGWSINADMGYTLLGTTLPGHNGAPTEPGGINGGMLRRQAPITSPVITIEVENIDESIGKIERLGGRVVRGKEPVSTIGFAAYFTDTEGNVLGLWQSAR